MSESAIWWLAFVLPLIFIVGGLLVVLMGMRQYSQTLEMKHRERMAMIERGIVPGPAQDPAAFERWQRRHDSPPGRATNVGVVVIALGIGFMLLVGFAGRHSGAAIGVGGATVALGIALIIIGELQRRSQPPPFPPVGPSRPSGDVGP